MFSFRLIEKIFKENNFKIFEKMQKNKLSITVKKTAPQLQYRIITVIEKFSIFGKEDFLFFYQGWWIPK